MCKLEINYALLHVIVNEIMIINILIVVSTCMVNQRTIRRRHFSVGSYVRDEIGIKHSTTCRAYFRQSVTQIVIPGNEASHVLIKANTGATINGNTSGATCQQYYHGAHTSARKQILGCFVATFFSTHVSIQETLGRRLNH